MNSRELSTNRLMAFFASLMAVAFALYTAGDLVDIHNYYDVIRISDFWSVAWTAFFALLFGFVSVTLFLEKGWSRVVLAAALDCLLLGLVVHTVYSAIEKQAWVSDLLWTLGIRLVPIACLLTIVALLHTEHRGMRRSRRESEGDGQAADRSDPQADGIR
jgi:hypothetical protein